MTADPKFPQTWRRIKNNRRRKGAWIGGREPHLILKVNNLEWLNEEAPDRDNGEKVTNMQNVCVDEPGNLVFQITSGTTIQNICPQWPGWMFLMEIHVTPNCYQHLRGEGRMPQSPGRVRHTLPQVAAWLTHSFKVEERQFAVLWEKEPKFWDITACTSFKWIIQINSLKQQKGQQKQTSARGGVKFAVVGIPKCRSE